MITYSDITRDDLTHPATVLGGAMVEGWTGPCIIKLEFFGGQQAAVLVGKDDAPEDKRHGPWLAAVPGEWDDWDTDSHRSVREEEIILNFMDASIRDRARRVLAAGARCSRDTNGDGDCGLKRVNGCLPCNGTGYARQPRRLGWITDAEEAGTITPEVAAALWWASVAQAAPVRLLRPWAVEDDSRWRRRGIAVSGIFGIVTEVRSVCHHRGWSLWLSIVSDDDFDGPEVLGEGPEVGDEGRACADAAALRAGCALLNPGHLLLPLGNDVVARLAVTP